MAATAAKDWLQNSKLPSTLQLLKTATQAHAKGKVPVDVLRGADGALCDRSQLRLAETRSEERCSTAAPGLTRLPAGAGGFPARDTRY